MAFYVQDLSLKKMYHTSNNKNRQMGLWEEIPTVKMHKTNLLKGMMREDVLSDFENQWNP